ncbi:MAG: hypothetical protein IJU74_01445 [Bacteroidales bacterium]|nr:hypothetical protein [Bacteroidales bacterium]
MYQTKLKAFALAAGFTALLGGLSSCNKEAAVVPEAASDVVAHAVVQAKVGDRGAATKASLSSGYELSWGLGDKLVMVSNGCVNGTLVCTEPGTPATFKGDVSQFTPSGVEFYFLGNHDASGIQSSFDLSTQNGTQAALVGFLFLKTASPVTLSKTSEEGDPEQKYELDGTVEFNPTPLAPILNLRELDKVLKYAGMVETDEELVGVKATSVKIDGLKNVLKIDLATGTVSAGMSSKTSVTTISPASSADRANSYYMAVVPQNATGLTLQINYTGSEVPMIIWPGINWNLSTEGVSFYTDWSNQDTGGIGYLSTKGGYSGVTVEGGETADGLNNKGGYNGNNTDGTSDNPQGSKGGYNGVGI